MIFMKVLSEVIGGYIAENAKRKFNDLEEALTHIFWWEDRFEVKKEDDKVISRGCCPVYKYYSRWCSEACLLFINKIAKEFGFNVERGKRQPESNFCEFIFKK